MKIKVFNELYGSYYNTVYHILKTAGQKQLSDKAFRELIINMSQKYGFTDITQFIVEKALRNGLDVKLRDSKSAWPFFERPQYIEDKMASTSENIVKSRLNVYNIPLSTLEKMWLKSICDDQRISLFIDDEVKLPDLSGVEPLFDWKDYVLFDQYTDGDHYEDEHYREMFRIVLKAIRTNSRLKIRFYKTNNILESSEQNEKDRAVAKIGTIYIEPTHIEYSDRDNRFRIVGNNPRYGRNTVNIASIVSCEYVNKYNGEKGPIQEKVLWKEVHLEIDDKNNALERFLFNFSHYNKETEFVEDKGKYRIKIKYDETDETDLLIRILSFGHHVRVVSPDSFVELMRERLKRQLELRA